jgi:RimJ/RimL family protein N-acetyltransferase
MNLQPVLENEFLTARPLLESDFDNLYQAASDPLVWDQHPNKNRYLKPEFQNFFKGAMESKGALIVFDKLTGEVIGSSRYYNWAEADRSIYIGYTFFSRQNWGKNYNNSLKTLMLNHAFSFAEKVIFHIGVENFRSQRSIEKLGAQKIRKEEVEYYGEPSRLNFVYEIEKKNW